MHELSARDLGSEDHNYYPRPERNYTSRRIWLSSAMGKGGERDSRITPRFRPCLMDPPSRGPTLRFPDIQRAFIFICSIATHAGLRGSERLAAECPPSTSSTGCGYRAD